VEVKLEVTVEVKLEEVKLEVKLEVVVRDPHRNNGYHILGTMNVQAKFVLLFSSVKTVQRS
jgi:hypothetical protein